MSTLHLNWDGRNNNGVIFNATYQGALFTGIDNRPALSFSFHSFQCSEVFEHPDYVINPDGTKRLMTPAEADEIKAVATEWIQPLGQEGNPTIAMTATQRITALAAACESAIVSGFTSIALGTAHTYQSDRDDQINLIGAVSAAADRPFKCADATGAWDYRLHTTAQLQQVLNDGAAVKLGHLQSFAIKKAQVDAIVADTTLTDNEKHTAIDAVVW